MKIKALNFDIRWKNKSENFQLIENQFANETADLFLLPEMFSTGFCMEAEEVADRNEETLTWMKNWAINKKSAICGSASVFENGKFFNRFYFVKPDGNYYQYDKRHLFSYSGEDKIMPKEMIGLLSNISDGEFCYKFVTTFDFLSFPETMLIMTPSFMSQIGRKQESMLGKLC